MIRCKEARRLLDARLDGEIGPADALDLESHLGGCAACRDVARGLEAVRSGLRELAFAPLPEDAFREVLARTVGSAPCRETGRSFARRALPWTALAAAAVLAGVALILPLTGPERSSGSPSPEEVARAHREARVVLALASGAVRSAESAARNRVLAGEVSPALRRLPLFRRSAS